MIIASVVSPFLENVLISMRRSIEWRVIHNVFHLYALIYSLINNAFKNIYMNIIFLAIISFYILSVLQ